VSRAGLTASGEFNWSFAPTSALFARHGLTRLFSIQPELVYVRRTGISSLSNSTLTLTADNVEVPVLFNLHFPSAFGLGPYLSAGPSVALRIRCRLQFVGGGVRSNDDCEGGGIRAKRLDLGVLGGAGLTWDLGAMKLVVETRGSAGLRSYVVPTDVRDARTVSWSVLAGVSMPLSRRTLPPVRLPPLIAAVPAEVPAPARRAAPAPTRAPVALAPGRKHITITADDVDVRDVIEGIAQATGYKVIVGTQVRRRVTAALFDVPADAAVQSIAESAGLIVLPPSAPGRAAIVVQNKSRQVASAGRR